MARDPGIRSMDMRREYQEVHSDLGGKNAHWRQLIKRRANSMVQALNPLDELYGRCDLIFRRWDSDFILESESSKQ